MDVLFLGTGNAFAAGGRRPLAVLLRAEGMGVLLDCGPSTLVALKQRGLAPGNVDVVLLSHHHGDHFAGVPFLVLHERYAGAREKPLRVYGPPRTRGVVSEATELLFPGLEPLGFPLELIELEAGEERSLGPLSLSPFEVDHFSRGTAFGYRLTLSGRTVVFSGDTAWTESLVTATTGADLFICECSSYEEPRERHLSHRELKENASRLGARRTVLVHADEEVIARRGELAFELAEDGTRMTL